jgi:hypothetical protein
MLFEPPELDALELEVLDRVEALKQTLVFSLPPRRWQGLLRRTTFARAVRGSNSIEGYKVTVATPSPRSKGRSRSTPRRRPGWLSRDTGWR